ncbi:AAA family ATPase [Chromobacterium sp. CV08]|uniref:AAA family ATPase n=1 Tax=Chromobacterium sp. CV08 TaxID=3133274 RepID=UPI003DA8F6AF
MKISSITIKNFQGLRNAALSFSSRIALIAGDNGAGKSSLRDAIAMALTGTATRVERKKDYGQLVSEGAKNSGVRVDFEDGRHAAVSLPDGKLAGVSIDNDTALATLPYVLDPALFAAAPADARRALLFALTGCNANTDEVEKRLKKRGADQVHIDAILPLVLSGFPAALKDAQARAAEARGAWKGITGEVYGDKKAVDWSVDAQAVQDGAIQQAQQDAQAVQDEIAQCQQQLGELRARRQQQDDRQRQVVKLTEIAAPLERIQTRLNVDQVELARVRDEVEAITAGPALRVGLVHDLARALNLSLTMAIPFGNMSAEQRQHLKAAGAALDQYAAEHGSLADDGVPPSAEDLARLPQLQHSLDMMSRTVANGERDLKIAADAAAQLQALQGSEPPAPVSEAEAAALIERINTLQASHKQLVADLAALQDQHREAVGAVQRTQLAAQHHADVQAWTLIADAMAPDGIPGEILADALRPVNDRLFELARLAGWARPIIANDMAISADSRAYGLLSESEKWRVDCVIALALSLMSGLRLVLLDRFDVLSKRGRGELLAMLEALDDELDSALVFGTLKDRPASDEIMQVCWIEAGEVATEDLPQAA